MIESDKCEVCGGLLVYTDIKEYQHITCVKCYTEYKVETSWDSDEKCFHRFLDLVRK